MFFPVSKIVLLKANSWLRAFLALILKFSLSISASSGPDIKTKYSTVFKINRAEQVHKLVRKSANPQLRTNKKTCGHADLQTLAV